MSLPSRFPERPAVTHWDHNEPYHGFLLRQLPAHSTSAAARASSPVGSRNVLTRSTPNVRWLVGDVLAAPLDLGGYDAVTAVASVHHMPLEAGLSRLAELVRPGGSLAVLGLAAPSAVDYALGVVGVPADIAVCVCKAVRGRSGKPDQQVVIAGETVTMPVRNSDETLAQIATAAQRLLPGAHLRRHLFYRYSLVWRRPG